MGCFSTRHPWHSAITELAAWDLDASGIGLVRGCGMQPTAPPRRRSPYRAWSERVYPIHNPGFAVRLVGAVSPDDEPLPEDELTCRRCLLSS